jgi:tetratricopeptide (TPR) repeat protein
MEWGKHYNSRLARMEAARLCALALLCASVLPAQSDGTADLTVAYSKLTAKDYDGAIDAFRRGIEQQPQNASAHKDLAYTLLKAGEDVQARDEFQKAIQLNPHDDVATLEYAFLCFESGKQVEARRTFNRLRQYGATEATRATAQTAFDNIDKPIAAGIARWKDALAKTSAPLDPRFYSDHWELARLAEERDDLQLAAEQYEICRRLKPQLESLLVDLARVWQSLNETEQAHAALLAASRAEEPRTAETALELLGSRYPYVYEFKNAIELDPKNVNLRRELAYLYLALHKDAEAIREFEQVLAIAPDDQLSLAQLAALRHPAPLSENAPAMPGKRPDTQDGPKIDPKLMGLKSLAAGYLNDAIRYLLIAHEDSPDDGEVMLQLGWAYNQAKNDGEAVQWFERARHSSNKLVASEADRAWHNLLGSTPAQTTVWAFPTYSSRWKDAFFYGQVKRTLPFTGALPFHFYLSARLIGDERGKETVGGLPPQYLSESAVIAGAGVETRQWHHLLGWAEAGEAFSYLPGRHDVGAAIPDYRGGINFAKGFGSLLGAAQPGLFYETTGDAIYINRFDKDWLFYSQHRMGRTFRLFGGDYLQAYANGNYVYDMKRQYWANTVEFGPGARLHLPMLPPGVYLSADWLRGVYTMNKDNPRGPNYNDFRLGFWYAATR